MNTTTPRETDLKVAKAELRRFQDAYHAIKPWTNEKRRLAEEIEFWSNKVAFLNGVKW